MDPLVVAIVAALSAVVAAGIVWRSAFRAPKIVATVDEAEDPVRSAPVFASYSRKDADVVRTLLGLFRATDLPIFRDEDAIVPGRKWRVAIDAALEECQTILVFWSGWAALSPEVASEFERAISMDKRVVPVLMDYTELPTQLGQYQGVDLRSVLGAEVPSLLTRGGPPAVDDRLLEAARRHLESSLDSIL